MRQLYLLLLVVTSLFSYNLTYADQTDPCDSFSGKWKGKLNSGNCKFAVKWNVLDRYKTTFVVDSKYVGAKENADYCEGHQPINGISNFTCENGILHGKKMKLRLFSVDFTIFKSKIFASDWNDSWKLSRSS